MQKYSKVLFLKIMRIGLFILFSVFFALPAIFCQQDVADSIRSRFDQFGQQYLQEKVYVHTDRSFYLAGEIIWFKIYDVDGGFNRPLDLSKMAYIEVVGGDQKALLQAKILLTNGTGSGSFFLPVSFNSGVYKIRAYTSWMKNFSPDYFFEKPLTIVNSLKTLGVRQAVSASAFDIQFFPEGGNLVSGIQSKVAFRIVDQNGKGVDCRGAITDQKDDTIVQFRPLRFGIGHFYFTPSADKKYKAILKFGINTVVINELPKVYPQGYVVNLSDSGYMDQIKVAVSTNANPSKEVVYLLIHTRQTVKIAEGKVLNNGNAVFLIDKSKLGAGISQFTIFNADKEPVCERLYFKRPESLQLSANSNQEEYASRQKITININAHDREGKPGVADMSVAVYLADSLQSIEQPDILSYFWLGSDLKGTIESPDFYFENTGTEVDEAVDNLMLTHGWRRFRWEDALQNKTSSFEFLPEYDGHIITGKVTDKRSGLPAENITTYLTVPGQRYQLASSVSNSRGQIQFDIKNFYGADELVVQMDNQKDSIFRIDLASPFSERFSSTQSPIFDFSEIFQDQLLTRSVATQVQNAYLQESLQKFNNPVLADSTEFYGQPDRKYFLDDYTRFNTMEEVLREYVEEIALRKHQGKTHFKLLAGPHRFFEDDALVLIDGVPIFDHDKIMAYDPLKIKKLEVVTREYFLGSMVASGILSYTTYKGDLDGFQLDPNSLVSEYEGIQLKREFYSPVYETNNQIDGRLPDFRNLLYWSPDIKTDAQGKKQFSFYSSDQKGRYRVVLQGITSKGLAGSQSFTFDVNKQ
jgi:hypothetical protein